MFDSHDGGTIKDGVTYCPKCEELYDPDGIGSDKAVFIDDTHLATDSSGLTPDQTATLDRAAFEEASQDAYEMGLDGTNAEEP
jgi:hypothetical protein